MRGIFISYRRDDSEGQAGRLFDDLSAQFGRDAVFMDVAGVKKGMDFRRIIDEHVASCGVLLVIIGKRWLNATDSKGRRRLDEPNDFVRLETAAALSRDIPVVPVLVQDAEMPKGQDLPDALKELAFRNGTELTHARWDSDVKLLIDDLKPYLEKPKGAYTPPLPRDTAPVTSTSCVTTANTARAPRRSLWSKGAVIAVVVGMFIVGYDLSQDRPTVQDRALAQADTPKAAERQSGPDIKAAPPVSKPVLKTTDETEKFDPTAARAEAAKTDAAKAAAARAAAAKKAAEQRKREEIERAAMLAEEQRKLDEQSRRIAQEQAEKNRIAAEQAAAAQMFVDIAAAVLGSRQTTRR